MLLVSFMSIRHRLAWALAAGLVSLTTPAFGEGRSFSAPRAAEILRALGPHAATSFAPTSGRVGALVSLPAGTSAESLGLDPVAPGVGRIRASAERVTAFGDAHPDLHMELGPPLHLLMDRAAQAVHVSFARLFYKLQGEGIAVGIVDTGLDVGHPDFLNDAGHTRVAWLLDLSLKPVGLHPELEAKFGIKDDSGAVVAGAVFSEDDLNGLLRLGQRAPEDPVGHGTHVASLAAGGGGGGPYVGIAPKATLIIARVTRASGESIENDDLLRGAQFVFDRADAMKVPAVVNLSLGSDFGPHDGSMLWEKTLASYIGPDKPGRALVAAAGNSGSVASAPTHQTVRVSSGTRMRVPIETTGATKGGVQVWVTLRSKGKIAVGLDSPDGTWIDPVDEGSKRGKKEGDYSAGVIFGAGIEDSPIPQGTRGAIVVWSGAWPAGRYYVTLEGEGLADLYLQATGDAAVRPASFLGGVREGTVNLPATHPSILSVGCTASRAKWTSIAKQPSSLVVPVLDDPGGYFAGRVRDLEDGEICWFSSAGPNADGVPKPEIAAPGAAIIGAMSRQAAPGNAASIFTTSNCPAQEGTDNRDPRCLQIDKTHGVSVGTSMSAPIVSGAVALLLQRDPTLTQDKIVSLLQSGAHRLRGAAPYDDQASPGELDVVGALYTLDQVRANGAALPDPSRSWITLSSSYAAADGSRPVTAILELRADENTTLRPDMFDTSRLRADVRLDGEPLAAPTIQRRGPGVYAYTVTVPAGRGGSVLSLGATFDGGQIVTAKTIPVAADPWMARYPVRAIGGCAIAGAGRAGMAGLGLGTLVALAFARRRLRRAARRDAA